MASAEVQWNTPQPGIDVPETGQPQTKPTSPWLFKASVRAGYFGSWPWQTNIAPKRGLTVGGQIGIARRRPAKLEEIGFHAAVIVRPFAIGPAVSTKVQVVDIHVGGLWVREVRGFRWFVGLGVPIAVIKDLRK